MNFFKRKNIVILFTVAVFVLGVFSFTEYTHADPTKDTLLTIGTAGIYPSQASTIQMNGTTVMAGLGTAMTAGIIPASRNNTGDGACWVGTGFFPNLGNCLAQLLYLFLWVLSFIVSVIGGLFDYVFIKTVRDIGMTFGTIPVINAAWTVVRDLCNIFFIFILLWLAISTILGLDEHGVKHGLSRLIVAAVLINFSLFFTKVVIDIPNMISVTIYNQVTGGGVQETDFGFGANGKAAGLGSALFGIISPEKVLNSTSNSDKNRATKVDTSASYDGIDGTNAMTFARGTPITTFFMLIILYATVLFVFLAVCIIFIKRFIILLFLMIFSPLAFLGMAVPIHSLQHEAQHKFWNTLFKEAFYAPIFLLCFYVAIVTGTAMYNAASTATATIFAFTVTIIMVIASLIIAEEMGVSGAGGAMTAFQGMSQGTAGWVGANTVGRVASTLINKTDRGDMFRDWAAGKKGSGLIGRTFYTTLGRGIVSTSDKLGASFDDKVKKDQEWTQAAIDNRHGDHKFSAKMFAQGAGDGMFSADRKMLDNQFHHMSLDQKANTLEYLKDMVEVKDSTGKGTGKNRNGKTIEEKYLRRSAGAAAAIKRFYTDGGHGRLEADEVAELPRKTAEGLTYHDSMFKHAVDHAAEHAQKKGGVMQDKDMKDVESFMKNATEGQMLSAIKSMGSSGNHFAGDNDYNKKLRASLTNNLMRFQGESMLSSITKDSVLSQGVKTAAADSAFQRKVTYDLFSAIKGKENKAGADEIAVALAEKTKELGLDDIKTEREKFLAAPIKDEAAIKSLTDAFQKHYSSMESTANYVINSNGRRSLIKSEDSVKILEKNDKFIKKVNTDNKHYTLDKDGNKVNNGFAEPKVKD